MKFIRRLLIAVIAGLALTMTYNSTAAIPAQAAAPTLYVNDTTSNDPSLNYCPPTFYNSFNYPDGGISEAVADASFTIGAKVIVCQGQYELDNGPVEFDGDPSISITEKFSLTTKGEVRVTPPPNYDGPMIVFYDCTSCTVSGFYLDGNQEWSSTSTYLAGILFYDSSGTISKNYISWIDDGYVDTNAEGIGIDLYGDDIISGSKFLPYKVTVTSNSIYEPKWVGINEAGNVQATMSKNAITLNSQGNVSTVGYQPWNPTGIYVETMTMANSISSNTITGDWDPQFSPVQTFGVSVYDSSFNKISTNTFTGIAVPIILQDEYANGIDGFSWDVVTNTISGNKASNAYEGIWLEGNWDANSTDQPYLLNNKISSNTMTASSDYNWSDTGVFVDDIGDCCSVWGLPVNSITGNTFLGYFYWYDIVSFPVQKFTGNKFGSPAPGSAAPHPTLNVKLPHFKIGKPPLSAKATSKVRQIASPSQIAVLAAKARHHK